MGQEEPEVAAGRPPSPSAQGVVAVVRAGGSSSPDLLDRDASEMVPVGGGWLCARLPSSMGTLIWANPPGTKRRDFGILSRPASLCSSGGFWGWGFLSPTLMYHWEVSKGQTLCAAFSCRPASPPLISLGSGPRCRLACQLGLANIRCEDWFICKLGKDHQFLICTSGLQALWSDFSPVCFEKENTLADKPKDLLWCRPYHLPLLHMLDATVSVCSHSNRRN